VIVIEQCGPLNTIQDLGRTEYRHLGVSVSGVMDQLALKAGNLILGNDAGAAAIELQMFPFRVRFTEATAVAITGADCRVKLDGRELPPWWAFPVEKDQTLEINFPRSGSRGYLCVAGGLDVPVVMGSRSTALRGAFGGHHGRFLQMGDELNAQSAAKLKKLSATGIGIVPPSEALKSFYPAPEDKVVPIRAIAAGEYELFCHGDQQFWDREWEVSKDSNRTGFRLSGTPLVPSEVIEMRSYGLIPGIVQVPPAGEPIIQLSDANTAGGYPKIACVIEEDLWRLGQLSAGSKIKFIETDVAESIEIKKAIDQWLNKISTYAQSLH